MIGLFQFFEKLLNVFLTILITLLCKACYDIATYLLFSIGEFFILFVWNFYSWGGCLINVEIYILVCVGTYVLTCQLLCCGLSRGLLILLVNYLYDLFFLSLSNG